MDLVFGEVKDDGVKIRVAGSKVALDGLKANGSSLGSKVCDGELGGAHSAVRGGGVDGDDAHKRKTLKDVPDEVEIMMTCLLEAPRKESRVRTRGAGCSKNLLNMRRR